MNRVSPPKNWNELNDLLWNSSFDPNSHRYRPYIAFRGLPEDYGNLRTGLQRLGDPGPQLDAEELRWRERRLIDSFSLTAHQQLPTQPSDWQILLLAQHYRLRSHYWIGLHHRTRLCSSQPRIIRNSIKTASYGASVVWRRIASCHRRLTTSWQTKSARISFMKRAFRGTFPRSGTSTGSAHQMLSSGSSRRQWTFGLSTSTPCFPLCRALIMI